MNIVHINIIYSRSIKAWKVKSKSRIFFPEPEFHCRNGVFVHANDDFLLSLEENKIHIAVQYDSIKLQLINDFLRDVFENEFIGVDMPKKSSEIALKSLNYSLI